MPRRGRRLRAKGVLARWFDRMIGRNQMMIDVGEDLPLVLATFPRGQDRFALALRSALRFCVAAVPEPVLGN